MKKFLTFVLFFVLLFSKVTLAQGPVISVHGNGIYFDDDYVFAYECVDFFNVHIERKSLPNYIIIENHSDSLLIISDIHIVGEGFRLINTETEITIAPGPPRNEDYLAIEFAPTVAKDYKGTITFTHKHLIYLRHSVCQLLEPGYLLEPLYY